ncbi:MAG: GNAT family N-acetyltransferase [Pseudomonadota bacterium]
MIPTIETERLILRAPVEADVAPFAAFYASDASAFVGGPLPDYEVWRYVAQVLGHWALKGFGRWMVEEKATTGAIGLIGLHAPLDWPEPEVGWMLWSGNGKGYATEAAFAARAYAYEMVGLTTLISSISDGNENSMRVARRMGAVKEPEDYIHPKYGAMQIWRHPSPEELAA